VKLGNLGLELFVHFTKSFDVSLLTVGCRCDQVVTHILYCNTNDGDHGQTGDTIGLGQPWMVHGLL
jgi:hypothetical protein